MRTIVPILAILMGTAVSHARGDQWPLVELQLDDQRLQGAPVHWSGQEIWLLQRDGKLTEVNPSDINGFRKVSSRFEGYSTTELRGQLFREFPGYEVTTTSHYLVCHPADLGTQYAGIFEAVYRRCQQYFSVRGVPMQRPRFPLVAVLAPDRDRFLRHAREEGVQAADNMVGLYTPRSNRIHLYDSAGDVLDQLQLSLPAHPPGLRNASVTAVQSERQRRNLSTILHEATHQVAFNTGLHNRFCANPQWVVEGLAMLFENPTFWSSRRRHDVAGRINRDRLRQFVASVPRGERGWLERLIGSDRPFQLAPLASYGQAWAVTFYLVETRPMKYAAYLERIAGRSVGQAYSADERLDDFQSQLGKRLALLEAEILRYYARWR